MASLFSPFGGPRSDHQLRLQGPQAFGWQTKEARGARSYRESLRASRTLHGSSYMAPEFRGAVPRQGLQELRGFRRPEGPQPPPQSVEKVLISFFWSFRTILHPQLQITVVCSSSVSPRSQLAQR